MDITVFYAWQMDTPTHLNKNLILKSAEAACERISQDKMNAWKVTIDRDTQNESGMCDIPNTILKKIRLSDIFLCDMTMVADTKSDPPKHMPNANVIFELGYATRKMGFGSIVAVINDHYGHFERQVFDVKRRNAIDYLAKPSTTPEKLAKVQKELSVQLEAAIRTIIFKQVLPRRKAKGTIVERVGKLQDEFVEMVENREFMGAINPPHIITGMYFVWPEKPDYNKLFAHMKGLGVNPIAQPDSIRWQRGPRYYEFHVSGNIGRIHFVSEQERVTIDNLLEHNKRAGLPQGECHFLPAHNMVVNIVQSLWDGWNLLLGIGIKPPIHIAVSLSGILGYSLLYPSRDNSRDRSMVRIHHSQIVTEPNIDHFFSAHTIGQFMKPILFRIFREFGEPESAGFNDQGYYSASGERPFTKP